MKEKHRRWPWIVLLAIVLIAIIVLYVNRSGTPGARYQEEAARSGSIETHYSFSGSVTVRNSQAVAAKVNATVREIYVREDDLVQKDDPLLRLSSGDVIKADIAGEVTEIYVSEGDAVGMGAQLMDLVDFTDLQAIFKVDEFDVGAVTVGKEASVTIGALGWTYQETVEHISKQAISSGSMGAGGTSALTASGGDVTYYEAKIAVPQDERILPGMKVDVRIGNEQADNTLLISMNALQFDAYNKPYVLMRGDRASDVVQVQVEVGIQDGTSVEILSGLRAGDVVLVPQSASLFPMMGQM